MIFSSFQPFSIKKIIIIFIIVFTSICQQQIPDQSFHLFTQNTYQKIYMLNYVNGTIFLHVHCKQDNILSISLSKKYDFEEAPRFNIYGSDKNPPNMKKNNRTQLQNCKIDIYTNKSSSLFSIYRPNTEKQLFSLTEIYYNLQYTRFTIYDQSLKWGLGERFQKNFQIVDGSWTIWNRDKPWKIDEGSLFHSDQTYGHQPVYIAKQQNKQYHMVYFKNTYGLLVESFQNTKKLIYNSVGGQIHFLFFIGTKNPQQLLQRYHEYIGTSHIPPFWSLGYHQSRWGYKSLDQLQQVIYNFKYHDLPIDVIWTDLDYMKNKMIFTIDSKLFPQQRFNQLLSKNQIHYVPLLDVAISTKDDIGVKMGKSMNVFFKKPFDQTQLYTGQVWPGQVYYIDYLHPNSTLYWKKQLQRLYNKVKFSGIWLDMNEPTNFKGGQQIYESFRIQKRQSINQMTINVNLKHYCQKKYPILHAQAHSYYGHLSVVPTFQFLQQINRPFIITRSNSVGTGYFAGHWTGDNVANWQFLRASINGNFLFQIFGIQMVGADICGFHQNTSNQLCARWMQLGAFYPFARNHNHDKAIDQQPYKLDSIVLQTTRKSFKSRYSLLKQMYTWLVQSKGKGSFFKPVAFQFYQDEEAFQKDTIQTQFILGSTILVAPIVEENQQYRYVYLPGNQQFWYQFQIDIAKGSVDLQRIAFFPKTGGYWRQNKLPSPPLTYLRSGYMILTTYPQNRSKKLSNLFNIFGAMKNKVSIGKIISIEDYNSNKKIEKCIKDGCFYIFKLQQYEENTFILSWNLVGSVISDIIYISEIIIAKQNTIYTWKQHIIIDQPSGIYSLKSINKQVNIQVIS